MIRPILAAALLISSAAEAADFSFIGTGHSSCGSWTASRRTGQASLPEQWILGFLSGVGDVSASNANAVGGVTERDPLNGVDAQAVWAWVDNYCRANPLDKVVRAGEAFVAAHPR
jgi:hypothetical protein